MDGTGIQFKPFMDSLPHEWCATPVRYPNEKLSYDELTVFTRRLLPSSEPFVLIAESFSGPIAIRLAAERPVNLKALVLCASFAKSPLEGFFAIAAKLFSKFAFRIPPPNWAVRRFLLGPDAPMEMVLLFHRALKEVSPCVLADRLHAIVEVDTRAELDRIKVPLLWLTAKQDRLVRGPQIEALPGAASNVRFEALDSTHLILQSRPFQSAAIIRQFLDQIPG